MVKQNHLYFIWIIVALVIGSIVTFVITQQVYNQKINTISAEKSNFQIGLSDKEKLLTDKETIIEAKENRSKRKRN